MNREGKTVYDPTLHAWNTTPHTFTCYSSSVCHRVTGVTLSDHISSPRHCHHSKFIGGIRKEIFNSEECVIVGRVCNYYHVHSISAVQIACTDWIVRNRGVKLKWTVPTDTKWCSFNTLYGESLWLTRRSCAVKKKRSRSKCWLLVTQNICYDEHIPMIVSWTSCWTGTPTTADSIRSSFPSPTMYCSDSTLATHLHTPLSLRIVCVKFSLTTPGPFSRSYRALSTIVVPSGAVQVMAAWGLLFRPVPQTRERLSFNST